jgi:hypothetical protein
LESQSGQPIEYWLVRNQENISKWMNMSTRVLLF